MADGRTATAAGMSKAPTLAQAEIIAIGSELLGATRLDTNSLFLTRELNALGIEVVRKAVLPDDAVALADAIRGSCRRVGLVLCCGGLGPTEDDRTREAAAAALGVGLRRDPQAEQTLRAYFERRQRAMAAINRRQCDRLAGAEWLANTVGSAPGQWCPTEGGWLALLPGPPPELQAMFQSALRPRLLPLAPARKSFTRVLSIAGMSESDVDTIAAPFYRAVANPATTILATAELQVELHFQAWAASAEAAQEMADGLAHQIEPALGDAVFSRDQAPLATVVGEALRLRNQSLALAESCTAGMVAETLTRAPGASDFFLGGVVCYSDQVKRDLLGVADETLTAHGAVSAACACELARGARQRCAADWAIAVTGIAGPGGGTPTKPVGTVFIALAGPDGKVMAVQHQLAGDRDRIRRWSTHLALNQLRLRLLLN
ncbi:MAG TPA: competence/damage-inducible protein A [Terriglobales bacterium]|nr:competence/damage-inducible protein A [Terriglobales bacterium]